MIEKTELDKIKKIAELYQEAHIERYKAYQNNELDKAFEIECIQRDNGNELAKWILSLKENK